jgi:hypothetical protein
MTKIGVEQADKDAGEHPDQILPDSFGFSDLLFPCSNFSLFLDDRGCVANLRSCREAGKNF